MEENIDVCIRVRPLNDREKRNKDVSVLRVLPALNAVSITDRSGTPLQGPSAVFQYDHIFQRVPTSTIYDQVARRIVASTLEGVNGTIFAYGQTSSGKTHTMTGNTSEPGILPLAVRHIFEYISASCDREFLIRVSYVEIYNEVIRDLLSDDKEKATAVKIREDPKKGIYLEAHEEFITDYDGIMRVVEQGDARRAVGHTAMNEHSSRSHSIFQIVIESKERAVAAGGDGVAYLVGVLNLVDLAGSESVRHTASEGARQREAGNINRSLLTLARVINALAQGPESVQSAPFRDSKLTRLLQNSLAGSTRTLIICCVTPSDRHLEESKSTLQFAARAKTIQMSATVNEVLDDQAQMKRLQREVAELRKKLQGDDAVAALKAQNAALAEEKSRQQAQIARLQGLIVTGRRSLDGPPASPQPKAKRARETWGPGEVAAFVATGAAAKKRKERHSEGSAGDLSLEIDALREALARAQAALREREAAPCAQCVAAEESAREFEALLETVAADRAALREQLAAKDAAARGLEDKLEEQTKVAAAFEELLESASQSRNELEDAYNAEVAKVRELESAAPDQRQYIDELEKDIAQLRQHYEEKQQAEAAAAAGHLERALADAAAAREQWERQIQALQAENEALARAQDDIAPSETETEALQLQLQVLQQQLDAETARRVEAEADAEAAREQLATEVQLLAEQLQAEKTDKDTVEGALTAQLRALEVDLETALTEQSRARAQASDDALAREAATTALEAELAAVQTAHAALEVALNEQQVVADKLQAQLAASAAQAEAHVAEQLATREAMAVLETSLGEAQDKCARLAFLETQAFEEKQAFEKQVAHLKAELAAATAALESAKDATYSVTVENQALRSQLEALEVDARLLVATASSDKSALDGQRAALEDRLQVLAQEQQAATTAHEEAIRALVEAKLAAETEAAIAARAAADAWATERTELRAAVAAHEAAARESDAARETLARTVAKLEETLSENQDKLYAQSVDLHQAQAACSAAEDRAAAAEDRAAAATAACDALKLQREETADNRMAALAAEVEALSADTAALQQALADERRALAEERQALAEERFEKGVLEKDLDETKATLAELDAERAQAQRETELNAQQQIAQVVEEKGLLYEQIEALEADGKRLRRELEIVATSERALRQEQAAARAELEVARSRIAKLELVKMTKHHLEIFQSLKLDNKQKSREIASLTQKLTNAPATAAAEVQALEGRLRQEQATRAAIEDRVLELELTIKTMENEVKIKASETAALQSSLDQYAVQLKELDEELHRTKKASEEAASAKTREVADVKYLEKENLDLHVELKHMKRLLAEASAAPKAAKMLPISPKRYDVPAPAWPTPVKSPSVVPMLAPAEPDAEEAHDCQTQ
ncbi:kinesin-like protein [Achlya hypogyna]|uniref:Kinesin-like protein n=1 Tax=Achlya hypogyna TaxID=1202772 RepID=A0A1V9YE88_ACHHY|nr:kinesin-like protein [Achlya hypogyna]